MEPIASGSIRGRVAGRRAAGVDRRRGRPAAGAPERVRWAGPEGAAEVAPAGGAGRGRRRRGRAGRERRGGARRGLGRQGRRCAVRPAGRCRRRPVGRGRSVRRGRARLRHVVRVRHVLALPLRRHALEERVRVHVAGRGVPDAHGDRVGDAHGQVLAGAEGELRHAQQEVPDDRVRGVVDGGHVERPRVPVPAVGRAEPGGGDLGAGRAFSHHERAGRHVAQPLVAGRQECRHDGDEADRDEEEVDQADRRPQERLLEPLGRAVDADHPQPHGCLPQRAAAPQRLERTEPDDDRAEAREEGDQRPCSAVDVVACRLEHDEQDDSRPPGPGPGCR